jgi:4-hydroxybenzoate polyprenyltransferase
MTQPRRLATTQRLPALLRSTHPGPSLAVTTVATALAVAVGRGVAGSVVVATSVLLGQVCIGSTNDLLDRDRDRVAGRTDKPAASGQVGAAVLTGFAWATGVTGLLIAALAGPWAAAATAGVLAGGLAYDLGLKATVWSWLPFVVSFGLLPAVATLGLPGHPWPPPWAMACGALLGVAAHLANALPDLADDAAAGVVGLPHRLGQRVSLRVCAGLLVVVALTLVLAPAGRPALGAWVALGLAVGASAWLLGVASTATRTAFAVVAGVAVIDVLLLVAQGNALLSGSGR